MARVSALACENFGRGQALFLFGLHKRTTGTTTEEPGPGLHRPPALDGTGCTCTLAFTTRSTTVALLPYLPLRQHRPLCLPVLYRFPSFRSAVRALFVPVHRSDQRPVGCYCNQ